MRKATLLLGFTILVAGCGTGTPPPTDTVVTGKITLDGVTLTMGEVVFENEAGTLSGRGEIASTGQFRVPSTPLGKVRAAVRTANYAQYAKPQVKDGKPLTIGGRDGTYLAVPKKYEDAKSSGLTFDITPDKVVDIVLTGK